MNVTPDIPETTTPDTGENNDSDLVNGTSGGGSSTNNKITIRDVEAVQDVSLDDNEELRGLLENIWPDDIPFLSVKTDLVQTDNRNDSEKEALVKELTEAQGSNVTITCALVLQQITPKTSGIFTFALTLPSDMSIGDKLIWSAKRSLVAASFNASELYVSDVEKEENAIFIDNAMNKETKTVPASKSVSVSVYLEKDYTYEPVIFSAKVSKAESEGSSSVGSSEDSNDSSQSSKSSSGSGSDGGGGGCVTATNAAVMLCAVLFVFTRNSKYL